MHFWQEHLKSGLLGIYAWPHFGQINTPFAFGNIGTEVIVQDTPRTLLGDQSLRSIGETVRREKALDFSGCNSRPGNGSLHPVAIEKNNDLSAYIFKSDFIPG